MANLGNTRMDKRKNPHEAKSEPLKKALKKNELLVQHKALEQKYEALQQHNKVLVEEQKKNVESIHLLEETVILLGFNIKQSKVTKKDNAPKAVVKSVAVQTEDMEIMRCNECEYPAEDIYDLGEHMYEIHTMENEGITEQIACYYCDHKFKTKHDLMKHRKEAHEEKCSPCSFFLEGKCVHGNQCWYSHENDTSKSVPEYRCRICETVFKIRFEFMQHRKQHHLETVPTCRDAFSGTCQFGRVKCWYNHDETDSSNANRNTEKC